MLQIKLKSGDMMRTFGDYGVKVLKPAEWKETKFGGYTTAMMIQCHCGTEIYLSTSRTECDCGRMFNKSGQQLDNPINFRNEE